MIRAFCFIILTNLLFTSFCHSSEHGALWRVRREVPTISDPLYYKQRWYLSENDERRERASVLPSLGVELAWGRGWTGRGITVMVVDDGVFPDNAEIKNNFDITISLNANTSEADPTPYFPDSHGTMVAGVIAGMANNGQCGVGIAYEATVSAVALPLDVADVTDVMEARALAHALDRVDIYSCSWGPAEGTYILGRMGPLAQAAVQRGATQGRSGLGSLYVWAAGNGGLMGNNCAYDGYVNSIYTIPVSSLSSQGRPLGTSEACSAVMVSAYAGDGATSANDDRVITTDDEGGRCVEDFSDSSAATPMVAASLALMLQANPGLTWKDAHHILVNSANSSALPAQRWVTNGASFKVSQLFGFGILDAHKMTQLAEEWPGLPPSDSCSITTTTPTPLPGVITLDASDCPHIVYLDHVEVRLSLTYSYRGHIGVRLQSPAGTRSLLLPGRYRDVRDRNLNWTVDSVAFWGESPHEPSALWNIQLFKAFENMETSGVLHELELTFHGLTAKPCIPLHTDCTTALPTDSPLKTTEVVSKRSDIPSKAPDVITTEPSVTTKEPDYSSESVNVWLIIGVIAAVLAILAAVIISVYLYMKHKSKRPVENSSADEKDTMYVEMV